MSRTATLLTTAALLVASLTSAASSSGIAPSCAPDILLLPPLEGHEFTYIGGLNDRGWAAGSSSVRDPGSDFQLYSTAVLWRDEAVLDLGVGGEVRPDGDVITSNAIDVNENGVIVGYRARLHPHGSFNYQPVSGHAWMWREGVVTRLATDRLRPHASVWALNDQGVAVGEVAATRGGKSSRPVIWRYGKKIRLAIPQGATGGASDINNNGLVIGWVHSPGVGANLWYWQLGGPSGPLNMPASEGSSYLLEVDNKDRILGYGWAPDEGDHALLWRGPDSRPSRIGGYALAHTNDMNDDGDLTGYRGGWRGYGANAWLGNLAEDKVRSLPAPKSHSWNNVVGTNVIRGVTWFSPDGGISVAGYGVGSDVGEYSTVRAIIWTCAQTY